MFKNELFLYFLKKIFIVLILILILSYCIYHTLNGEFNLKIFLNKKNIRPSKEIELKNIERDIDNLKNKIEKLEKNIDEDFLDEEIKKNTPFVEKNEIIIYSNSLNNDKN